VESARLEGAAAAVLALDEGGVVAKGLQAARLVDAHAAGVPQPPETCSTARRSQRAGHNTQVTPPPPA